jgi:putative polyketide hydroxylase
MPLIESRTMQTPILIIGGGPAGLCSSISLSRLGIRSILVERHPSASIHPKATAISTRTMELFRSWGLEAAIRSAALNVEFMSSVRANLSSPELDQRPLGFPTREEARAISATAPAVLAQDLLEPILLAHARSYHGADIRFNTELCSFEQHEVGVRATVMDRATGERTDIAASYMIGADGSDSRVRRALGIPTHGADRIGEYLSILFRADLDALLGDRQFGLYSLNGLGGSAPSVALPTSRDGRWVLATPWRSESRPLSSLTTADKVGLVRAAAGVDTLAVDVVDAQVIEIGAAVADRFRDRNVFLVGDAAHRTAPTGGTGMNTAIHGAHNLAWKLAAVLRGIAGAGLLDSYEAERRPSGERNLLRSRGQLQGVSGLAADMGVVYSSGAVVADNELERPDVIEPTQPARAGSRAPHVWLNVDREPVSIQDLFGYGFVLLTGVGGAAWRRAAPRVAEQLGVPFGVMTIGGAELSTASDNWLEMYGIDAAGAVLVRPDGHIAWRCASAAVDPTAILADVMSRILSRPGVALELSAEMDGSDRRCA